MEQPVSLTPQQYGILMRPLNTTRVAKRSQGGKQLSYLESYDVRAHLIRVFGFGGFDLEMVDSQYMGSREYESSGQTPKPMIEVIWMAKMQLTIPSLEAVYCEAAVGSASGPANMLGEHHDNALKTAASDALKRCAINLGTQFGLSLYDNGSTREIVKQTMVVPEGVEQKQAQNPTPAEAQKRLEESLGAQEVNPTEEGQQTNEVASESEQQEQSA